MDHFEGVTPENRWKNDVLNELRDLNRMLKEFQPPKKVETLKEPTAMKRTYSKRKGVS